MLKEKVKKRKGGFFKKLFLTYIVFLMIPLSLFATFFFVNVFRFFTNEINDSNMDNLKLLQEDVDAFMERIKNNVLQIGLNKDVQELFEMQNKESTRHHYYYVEKNLTVGNILLSYKVLNNDIQSIYLFNDKTDDLIVSWKELYTEDNFFDTRWMDVYRRNRDRIKVLPIRKPVNEELMNNPKLVDVDRDIGSDVTTFIYPLELFNTFNYQGALVVNIHKRVFELPYDQDNEMTSLFYIMDDQGAIISKPDNQSDQVTQSFVNHIIQGQDNKGFFNHNIKNKKYMISYVKSEATGLIYIKAISLKSLYKQINYFKLWLMGLSLLIFILGLIFAYAISKKFYNPIGHILEKLKEKIDRDKDRKNELDVISDVVGNILEEDQKIMNLFESNKFAIRQTYVMQIIRGDFTHLHDVFYDNVQKYCALVLSIDRYIDFSKNFLYKEQYYYKTLLLKIAEEVSNQAGCVGAGSVIEQDKVVLLLGLTDDCKVCRIQEITKSIMRQTAVLEDFTISIGVGNVYKRRERIRLSYLEAIEVLNYRVTMGYNSINTYEAMKDNESLDMQDTMKEKYIINYLKKNDYDDIEYTMNAMVKQIKDKGNVASESIMPIFYSLLSRTMNYLIEANISVTEVFEKSYDMFRSLAEQDTIEEMRDLLLYIYRSVINFQENNNAKDKKHIQQVLALIHENYSNSELDLNWLVDKLDISYSHLRKIIKDNLGVTFIHYLNHLRINESKVLLAKAELTVKDIAIQIGYNNTQSFTRYFKKYEGITPGEFRDL